MLFAGMLLPQAGHAQTKPASLSEAQLNGKKVMQQRCSICHTPPLLGDKIYGPALSADSVANEAAAREIIMKGTQRMPGFQYGLESKEIENIIAYLKTVKKAPTKQQE